MVVLGEAGVSTFSLSQYSLLLQCCIDTATTGAPHQLLMLCEMLGFYQTAQVWFHSTRVELI